MRFSSSLGSAACVSLHYNSKIDHKLEATVADVQDVRAGSIVPQSCASGDH
jgi:hypothetical protein